MKSIKEYIINENKTSDKVFCEQFSVMLKGTKLNNETIQIMLGNLSNNMLKLLSDTFAENDQSNYVAYQPNDDLFINYETNKETIIKQISEYILKNIVQ